MGQGLVLELISPETRVPMIFADCYFILFNPILAGVLENQDTLRGGGEFETPHS